MNNYSDIIKITNYSTHQKTMTMTLVKCDCSRCSCEISLANAIKRGNKNYCCEACANGHESDQGCKMSGCGCN